MCRQCETGDKPYIWCYHQHSKIRDEALEKARADDRELMRMLEEAERTLERKKMEEVELPPPSWAEVAREKSREELLAEADELEWELTPAWKKLTYHSLQAIKRTPGVIAEKTATALFATLIVIISILEAAVMGVRQVSPIVWLLGGAIGFDIAFVIGCLLLL